MEETSGLESWEQKPVLQAGRRLGVRWPSWMGDWFCSWSPRNGNENAEGTWAEWAQLAARILAHPFTEKVAPDLYRPDPTYAPDPKDLLRAIDVIRTIERLQPWRPPPAAEGVDAGDSA